MKNKKLFANLILKSTIAVTLLTTACASLTSEFSRSTASKAVETDARYQNPANIALDMGGREGAGEISTEQVSFEDTAEAALARAKTNFEQKYPRLAVAEKLDFIKLTFDAPSFKAGATHLKTAQDLGMWYFTVRAEITDRGRSLWKQFEYNVNEKFLPLAVREAPEITGVTDENQTNKRVDFTYKWKATELGEAFDPNSAAFAKLSPELQESLKKVNWNMFSGSNKLLDFTTPRKGLARFKKFDDGWRLEQLNFL